MILGENNPGSLQKERTVNHFSEQEKHKTKQNKTKVTFTLKYTLKYTYNGLLFSLKDWHSDTYNNMDEP